MNPAIDTAKAPPAAQHSGTVLAVACLTQLLVVLDLSIVNVAIPSIDTSLHFSAGALSWVVNAYVLVFGGLLLLGGRIADLVGLRRALFCGLAVFGVASVAGGLAQNPGELIAARAVQGLAGAVLAPVTLTTIMVTFTEPAARQRAVTIWAMVGAGGSAVGVLLGGILTEALNWRWVLFVNVPLVLVVLVLALPSLYDTRPRTHQRLDLPGAVLGTATVSLLVYGLIETDRHPWGSARTIGTLVLAVLIGVAFVWVESHQQHPLVRLRVFTEGHVSLATVITLTVGAATVTGFYFASLFLQNVLHYSPIKAGACFLPFCFGVVIGSFASRALMARFGPLPVVTVGLVVAGGGIAWFAALDPASTFWDGFLGPSLVASIGLGAALVTTTTLATGSVAPHEAGLVSGIINASRQIGGSVGLAAMTAVATATASGSTVEAASARGYDFAFLITGVLVAAAGLVAPLVARRVTAPPAPPATDGTAPAS